jgi:tyrosyl-tRNA synthetase
MGDKRDKQHRRVLGKLFGSAKKDLEKVESDQDILDVTVDEILDRLPGEGDSRLNLQSVPELLDAGDLDKHGETPLAALMAELKMVDSSEQAHKSITAGLVSVNGNTVTDPAQLVNRRPGLIITIGTRHYKLV